MRAEGGRSLREHRRLSHKHEDTKAQSHRERPHQIRPSTPVLYRGSGALPIEIASLTAIVQNSIGVPDAARTPSLTLEASRFKWMLQGVTSFQELATPMNGRR